jgi:uncharacterized protein (DUF2126 family)
VGDRPWFFRDERMYLIPGDSPMGYRLPLDSLPWVKDSDYPYLHDYDPFAPRGELPAPAELRRQMLGLGGGAAARRTPMPRDTPARLCRRRHRGPAEQPAGRCRDRDGQPARGPGGARHLPRALPVGPLDHPHRAVRGGARPAPGQRPQGREVGQASGVLYVFMPPLAHLEDYLELLTAVEATAAELGSRWCWKATRRRATRA